MKPRSVRILELERLGRDHEHLDVGHVVRDPAGDASRDDHLLDHVRRKSVRGALSERLQLVALRGRHPPTPPLVVGLALDPAG